MTNREYAPLSPETLPGRLGAIPAIASRLGSPVEDWSVQEVGDGNLNLVFIVEGAGSKLIVKQALPYVRLVGEGWPLPLYRAFYEYHALTRQAARAPGMVPEIYYFDEVQALLVMEYLSPHVILRRKLINGERVEALGAICGNFCAQTAFRGSALSMNSADKKADIALFAGNVEIPKITENLVFTEPYFDAEMNNHTDGLDPVVAEIRGNVALKGAVQAALQRFESNSETMVHGDLHSGSIMATDTDARIIDPEFVQYGPMGFDIGMLTANYLMAFFSQPGHRGADLAAYQEWILQVIADTFANFDAAFQQLWTSERSGILYPKTLFEDQGHSSMGACRAVLDNIWQDALQFCGIEMHRRCLSLAHNADFEEIDDIPLRARLEARNLRMGAHLILNADNIADANALLDIAREFNGKDGP